MKTLTSVVAILLVAAPLTGCVGAETDDMDYEDEPEAQLENEASPTEPTAEASEALLSSWDEQMYTDDPNPGGRVRFETTGDIVEVCDIQADGKAVDVYYSTIHLHVGGSGNCVTGRASMGGAFNLEEDRPYEFRICLNGDEWCDHAAWYNEN